LNFVFQAPAFPVKYHILWPFKILRNSDQIETILGIHSTGILCSPLGAIIQHGVIFKCFFFLFWHSWGLVPFFCVQPCYCTGSWFLEQNLTCPTCNAPWNMSMKLFSTSENTILIASLVLSGVQLNCFRYLFFKK